MNRIARAIGLASLCAVGLSCDALTSPKREPVALRVVVDSAALTLTNDNDYKLFYSVVDPRILASANFIGPSCNCYPQIGAHESVRIPVSEILADSAVHPRVISISDWLTADSHGNMLHRHTREVSLP